MTYEDIETFMWDNFDDFFTEDELATMTVEQFRYRVLQGGKDGTKKLQGVYDPEDPRIDFLVGTIYEQQTELWESNTGVWLAKWGVAEIEVTRKDGSKYTLFHDTETGKHIKTKEVDEVRREKAQRKYQSPLGVLRKRRKEERGYRHA